MNKNAVRKRLKAKIKKMKSQAAVAREFGVKPQYISDMANGRRDFSERILKLLGLRIDYVEID